MTWQHPHELAKRAGAATFLLSAIFLVFVGAFFRLQVLGSDRYAVQSRENRLRPVRLPAPRGVIVDRNNRVIAENVPSYTVSLLATDEDAFTALLDTIAKYVVMPDNFYSEALRRFEGAGGNPVLLMRDARLEIVAALEERRYDLPGLIIQTEPKRRYPMGAVGSHIVGYVGEVFEEELASDRFRGARLGTIVGRTGLELQYDEKLRGYDGERFVVVNALGRMINQESGTSGLDPRQGDTLRTTIDLDLQEYIAGAFPAGRDGAVMAMDPRSGEILAMHSEPSYDANVFIGGVDPYIWNALLTSERKPLLNRATQGMYPPASPWKLAVAYMALRRGIVSFEDRMARPCTGGMLYGNRYFRCWARGGHGDLNLTEAIQHSCDVYFYQLGLTIGLDTLLKDGAALGFASETGVDLPNELRPVFPSNTEYFDRKYGARGWTSGVTLNLAIGQGENTQTLINMMRFYSMLARDDGTAPVPSLVASESQEEGISLSIDPEDLQGLRHALLMVVEGGTAAGSRVADLHIA
ncbi:MAG: penicillin-binding transpeptidase domain-containing protein, partial [Gemmatimonadota bacterium]|nr:penicillin-binding transpeptidase domain-containing protein [Gemmatimonadota bacterium]